MQLDVQNWKEQASCTAASATAGREGKEAEKKKMLPMCDATTAPGNDDGRIRASGPLRGIKA